MFGGGGQEGKGKAVDGLRISTFVQMNIVMSSEAVSDEIDLG